MYPNSLHTRTTSNYVTLIKLEALRECRPPWPRQIIHSHTAYRKMLSLGGERLSPPHPPPPKKNKKSFGSLPAPRPGYATTIILYFFTHLLILKYPDHHQNLISSSLYYPGPLHKISSQSVHNFLSNVVHRQTDKQTNQPDQKHNLFCQVGNNVLQSCYNQHWNSSLYFAMLVSMYHPGIGLHWYKAPVTFPITKSQTGFFRHSTVAPFLVKYAESRYTVAVFIIFIVPSIILHLIYSPRRLVISNKFLVHAFCIAASISQYVHNFVSYFTCDCLQAALCSDVSPVCA